MKIYTPNGTLHADTEGNGSRVALYAPTDYTGYRQLVIAAELQAVTRWGMTRMEWIAIRLDHAHRAIPVASRAADTLYSFQGVAEWLAELLEEV